MQNKKTARMCSKGNNKPLSEKCDNTKCRNWCFTSFNKFEPIFLDEKMVYLCFSPEICPTTKKNHFQGFCVFKNQIVLKSASKLLGNVHVIKCNGTPQQNRIYCGAEDYEKDGKLKLKNLNFKEFGTLPIQGKRNDIVELKNRIINGEKLDDITIENPMAYHQYGRTLSKIEDICLRKKKRSENCVGTWYYGPTGTGKSHHAYKDFNPDTHYNYKGERGGWWDGYTGQKTVIINDFRGAIPYDELLKMVDIWPFEVPRRNREPVPLMANHIIITSSLSPEEVYCNRNVNDNINQLLRRFKVIKLDKPYIGVPDKKN